MRKLIRSLSAQDIKRARRFRKNMSESEQKLWRMLRYKAIGYKFRRQYPIGAYILDFYCPKANLCVEVDGDLHALRLERDSKRDAWLKESGIETLRIPTTELYEQPEAVGEMIWLTCSKRVEK